MSMNKERTHGNKKGKERSGRVKKVLGLKREGGEARESVRGVKRDVEERRRCMV